jgi:hypothetical protein
VLNASEEWLIGSLIHKFAAADLKGEPPPVTGRFYIFVDECHRTQGGDLHKTMKALMPSALFVGRVRAVLDALGVRVLSCISGDGRYNEVASAHRARANMMVCSKSMINIATRMQQRWDIPYFEGSFYGIGDMSTTLREIARLLVERGAPTDQLFTPPRKPAPGAASAPTASGWPASACC